MQQTTKHNKILKYKCTIGLCRRRYLTEEKLLEHFNKHEINGRYKCTSCTYTTNSQCRMTRHMNIHTGTYPYSCEHYGCTYQTVSLNTLTVHMRTHTKERPYVCPHKRCDYKAGTNSNLLKHIKCMHNKISLVDKASYAVVILTHLKDDVREAELREAELSVIDVEN